MNIIFTHKIIKLAGKNSVNNLDKVITRIDFNIKGMASYSIIGETPTIVEIDVNKYFTIFLQFPNPNNFILYSGLTEDIVSTWIKTNPSYLLIQDIVTKEIEKKINTNQENVKKFDFENSIFPWMENPL